MRFSCPYCSTDYRIAPDKLSSEIIKVQCRVCDNVFAVRAPADEEELKETEFSGPPSHADTEGDSPNAGHWFHVHRGEKKGPFSLEELSSLVADGTIEETTYVWRPGMEGWLRAAEVEGLGRRGPGPPGVETLWATWSSLVAN